MSKFLTLFTFITFLSLSPIESVQAQEAPRPLLLHVKTSLAIDDAQICVFPNLAWAALAEGRPVTVIFDGSAVTSITRGYGWRGWFGMQSTAMERAGLPERERKTLIEQLNVTNEQVPHDYGEYLKHLHELGAKIYYNSTMALLYNIKPEQIDDYIEPLGLEKLLETFKIEGDYVAY